MHIAVRQDISNSHIADLRDRKQNSVIVTRDGFEFTNHGKALIQKYDEVVEMDSLVETYRDEYVLDLSRRLGVDEDRLPIAYTFMALLNPMFGCRPVLIGSKLMTPMQYDNARELLVRAIQDELDLKNPIVNTSVDSDSDNSLDGDVVDLDNDNRRLAERELRRFESFKMQRYIPTLKFTRCLENIDNKGRTLKIGYGTIESRGEDLPSGKNLATYLDDKGRPDLLTFFHDHQTTFPNLFTIVQREASRRVVEVGCERFFNSSGYVSQPRRSQLGVKNYERISLLSVLLNSVYIDPEWVATEYLRRCKKGAWKKDNTIESMKCFNLERILEAEELGQVVPEEMTLEDYVGEVILDLDD